MRSESALSWTAAALLCGATEMLVFTLAKGGDGELVAAITLVPIAYLCFSQAVRIATGGGPQQWGVIGASLGLAGFSLVLLAAGAPFLVLITPFQFACALGLWDGILRLARVRPRGAIDLALIGTMTAIAAIFLIRVPLFPAVFGLDVTYGLVKTTAVERVLLIGSAALTPPSVFLLLARIIGGVIAKYRLRSERDHLTGVLNRQAFEQAVCAEPSEGGAVMFCDIDQFKRVNDRYGHHVGDEVIRLFARVLDDTGFRVGRLGGEEFALFLPGCSASDAAGLAEILRMHFHASRHAALAPDHRLSASFGVADYSPGETPVEALIRADVALYRAKESGRNRVAIFHAWDMLPAVQEPPSRGGPTIHRPRAISQPIRASG